jgi:hypothetical protein
MLVDNLLPELKLKQSNILTIAKAKTAVASALKLEI